MASMTHASAESPTALDRYRRDRARLGGSVRDADAGSARIDRDSRLLDALRQGEPTAAEELVATYGNRAYRLAMWITGKGQDAEEAVQDAFWSVIRKIDTFRGNSAFGSWIYRIVSNAAYAKVRRRQPAIGAIAVDEVLMDWSSTIDDPAVRSELRTVLSSAISELPVHYRAVVVMRDVEGLSMAEIADGLGLTVATAKTRVHRARLLLRSRLNIFMTSRVRRHDCSLPE
jgi:RNA polymerase sigma-70 factor (ECF subfamily)